MTDAEENVAAAFVAHASMHSIYGRVYPTMDARPSSIGRRREASLLPPSAFHARMEFHFLLSLPSPSSPYLSE